VNFGGLPIFTPRDLARLSCHIAPPPYPLGRGKDGPANQKLKREISNTRQNSSSKAWR
jgi:hypothetical protein